MNPVPKAAASTHAERALHPKFIVVPLPDPADRSPEAREALHAAFPGWRGFVADTAALARNRLFNSQPRS